MAGLVAMAMAFVGLIPPSGALAETPASAGQAAPQAEWAWSDQSTPPGSTVTSDIGTITVKDSPSSAQRPYVFVRGNDGHLWVNWWSGSKWTWSDQSTPPNVSVASGIGAITVMD
ncbi:hypothetical protein, partial [Streptomyces graminilatus]|uniref:hypothetical protein n=1 Tax=Streptomyces graminilatus TaxID=1464070 RepID=UPI0018E30085